MGLPETFVDLTFESAENIVLRWDSTVSEEARDRMIFDSGDRSEIDQYLRAVDEIQRSLESATLTDDHSKIKTAIKIAMARLEDEFRNLLTAHTFPLETDYVMDQNCSFRSRTNSGSFGGGELQDESSTEDEGGESRICVSYRSTSSICEIDLIPSEALSDLRNIAERMISAGYLRECVQVCVGVRKSGVDSSLVRLGIEKKSSIEDIQVMEWDLLETMIRWWIRAAKVSFRIIFASEKKLCEEIFGDFDRSIDDFCFLEIVRGQASQLFNFAEAISISPRSPEKLFKILDLHDAVSGLLPDVEVIFESKSAESIRVQAVEILSELTEAVRVILSEFENAILQEPSKVLVPGGTIHPLTRYVMNYVSLISDYKQTLIELIVSKPTLRNSDDPTDVQFEEVEGRTPLASHLIWIIVILQSNLDGKSKTYKDPALASLFMMNNVHYIVQKAKGFIDLREMIGDGYLKKLSGRYRQLATSYQRSTMGRVLHCLRDEGLHGSGSFSSGVSKNSLKERFKSFNATFEEIHKTQAMWLIPDAQLREELRISISELLIPAYTSFLNRFRSYIDSGKHPETFIKYSPDDLEAAILDFFEGTSASQQQLRRKS